MQGQRFEAGQVVEGRKSSMGRTAYAEGQRLVVGAEQWVSQMSRCVLRCSRAAFTAQQVRSPGPSRRR
jgi:hypothetical protein